MQRELNAEEHDVALAQRIAMACYGADARLEPLSRLNNAVFRVRFGGETRILKLALSADAASMRKEHLLLHLVGRHGIPVPRTEHADLEGRLEGRPFLSMFDAGGANLADTLRAEDPDVPPLMHEMGVLLARIHGLQFARGGDIRADGVVPRDTQAYVARVLQRADWAVQQGLIEAREAASFRALPLPGLDGTALLHGDFHAVQCIVRDARIAAVVDWEKAWAGNPDVDLAVTHAYLESYCPAEPLARFFEGYATLRPLPASYARSSLVVRMAHVLGMTQAWHRQGRAEFVARGVELFRAYARAAR